MLNASPSAMFIFNYSCLVQWYVLQECHCARWQCCYFFNEMIIPSFFEASPMIKVYHIFPLTVIVIANRINFTLKPIPIGMHSVNAICWMPVQVRCLFSIIAVWCSGMCYRNVIVPDGSAVIMDTSGSFSWHGLTLIPAWISNHMPSKAWYEITYPFLNFNGCTVEV